MKRLLCGAALAALVGSVVLAQERPAALTAKQVDDYIAVAAPAQDLGDLFGIENERHLGAFGYRVRGLAERILAREHRETLAAFERSEAARLSSAVAVLEKKAPGDPDVAIARELVDAVGEYARLLVEKRVARDAVPVAEKRFKDMYKKVPDKVAEVAFKDWKRAQLRSMELAFAPHDARTRAERAEQRLRAAKDPALRDVVRRAGVLSFAVLNDEISGDREVESDANVALVKSRLAKLRPILFATDWRMLAPVLR